MKRFKKWGAMLLTAGMIFSLTACSQPEKETKTTQQRVRNRTVRRKLKARRHPDPERKQFP